MKINEIRLRNYRNHKDFSLAFNEKVTLIQGTNGIGKSNILEAIRLLSTGYSNRARYDRDLILYEQIFCSVSGNISNNQGKMSLEIQVVKTNDNTHNSVKKCKVNKVPKTIRYLVGLFNTVLFSPEDISIILGSPSDRRRFIDNILIQTDDLYKRHISSYVRAVRQRNKVLEMIRDVGAGYDQLEYWDDLVITHGSYIQKLREQLFTNLGGTVADLIKSLDAETSTVEICYQKNEMNRERLIRHREHEIGAKTTLVGPHRDDFSLIFNGHDLAEFGSRGQQRTTLLAVKLAEVEYFKIYREEKPVLLLDDIFSELDERHKKTVLDNISNQQTIITFAEKPDFIVNKGYKLINLG